VYNKYKKDNSLLFIVSRTRVIFMKILMYQNLNELLLGSLLNFVHYLIMLDHLIIDSKK